MTASRLGQIRSAYESFVSLRSRGGAGFPSFQSGAFQFAKRDHLPCVRARQLTPAGETAAAANLSEILADLLWSFSHLRLRKRQAESALEFIGQVNDASTGYDAKSMLKKLFAARPVRR